jgi:5-oxopent-3-ene-1,2,5-tricarboxylate decarboxylase / 2-hydroxyhepta-2,4-diene-1,7-dioate isomerase
MGGLNWGPAEAARLAAIRDDLAQVSTATAHHMLGLIGWRNTYLEGLLPLQKLGLERRLVGRARTVRYLMRRAPETLPRDEEDRAARRQARRRSPEIVLIESLEPGDIFCVDALGIRTAGIIGDILTTRIRAQGALAAVVHGVVRDTPFVKTVGLPVFCAGAHPSASGRDLIPVDFDLPVNLSGAHVAPGDILLADDEGVVAMPLDLAEYVAANGPPKELLELWIRGKVEAGGSIHDYYPPSPEKEEEYRRETGRGARHG